MKSADTTIGSLLSEKNPFLIPQYQRAYDWDKENIEEFVRDLRDITGRKLANEVRREHFFGGIVTVMHTDPRSQHGVKYDVVDGQQRLTTFTILLKVMAELFRELGQYAKKKKDEDTSETASTWSDEIVKTYILYKDTSEGRPKDKQRLSLSRTDHQYFEDLIKNDGIPIEDTIISHQKLRRAKLVITKSVSADAKIKSADPKESLRYLEALRSTVTQDCTLVHLIASTAEEAYNLFRVLNYRGKNLSDFDLLRATTLEKFSQQEELAPDAERELDAIRSGSEADEKMTTDFLMHYFASVQGQRPRRQYIFEDYMSHELLGPKKFQTQNDATAALLKLKHFRTSFSFYNLMVDGKWPWDGLTSTATNWQKQRLSVLLTEQSHKLSLPLLLAMRDSIDEETFSKLVFAIEIFFFRTYQVCGIRVSDMQDAYELIAKKLRTGEITPKEIVAKLMKLEAEFGTTEIFVVNFPAKVNYSRRAAAKYCLIALEDLWQWRLAGCPAKISDQTRVFDYASCEIEHVYPQNADDGQDEKLEAVKDEIGNLTFWSPDENKAASNAPFSSKLQFYQASSLNLNQELAKCNQWNFETYSERKARLLEYAKQVFALREFV